MSAFTKTEGQHKGEFLVSEGNNSISRESYRTLSSGQKVTDGRLMKLVGGELVVAAGTVDSSGDSTEDIVGFIYGDYDASATGTNADIPNVVTVERLAEVDTEKVVLHAVSGGGEPAATAAVKAALAAKFIFLR